jgi:SAM-dependent methyltransferase
MCVDSSGSASTIALMTKWQCLKGKLATPLIRRLLRRPNLFVVRAELAAKYLRGEGIEIGALNRPLPLPSYAHAHYVDHRSVKELIASDYRGIDGIKEPDIIADAETLAGIETGSLDFVIANHVLEHVENPLLSLSSISRVLRPGGIAYIALPDKRFTFDKHRAVTPLSHIIRDFREGPLWSRREHYLDYVAKVDRAADVEKLAGEYERRVQNIHFHVWDFSAMQALFAYASSLPEIALAIEHGEQNRSEAVWILRKR